MLPTQLNTAWRTSEHVPHTRLDSSPPYGMTFKLPAPVSVLGGCRNPLTFRNVGATPRSLHENASLFLREADANLTAARTRHSVDSEPDLAAYHALPTEPMAQRKPLERVAHNPLLHRRP